MADALRSNSWRTVVAAFAEDVRKHYGKRLAGVYLFGSRARGDHHPSSDADIAIVLKDDILEFWHEKEVIGDMAFQYLLSDGLYIQALPVSAREWTAHRPESAFIAAIRLDAGQIMAGY